MNLLSLKEFSGKQIEKIINNSIAIKKNPKKYHSKLSREMLALVFQKTSTRTHTAFETAISKLGGDTVYLDWRTSQFSMADIRDESRSIAGSVDVIGARLLKHDDLVKMASVSNVPVINCLTEKYHPTQAICDLMTVKEHMKKLKNVKLTYVGIANNVSNSLTSACLKTGVDFTLCSPESHPRSVDKQLLSWARKQSNYHEVKDPKKAVSGADIVYADTWVDMELFLNPKFKKEKARRIKKFKAWQVNKKLLPRGALFMHDLPAHRGYEVDDYVLDSKNSIAFDQAENKMHSARGVLLSVL